MAGEIGFADKEIVLVTGKGGVGKSTVAAAIAMEAAASKLQTKLVELDLDSYYQKLFKVTPNMAGQQIDENISISRWTGMECLSEYVDHLSKIRGLGKLFFDNPVMSRLLEIAPGLFELAILGKLTSKQRKHGPSDNSDFLVLDSYATGHSLSMLRAPKVMSESISAGPMHDQSQGILDVIKSNRTQIIVVSTPELMAIEESLELKANLEKDFGITPVFVLNKCIKEFNELPSMDNAWEKYLYSKNEDLKKIKEVLTNEGVGYLESPFVLNAKSSFDLLSKVSGEWNLF